MRYLACRLCLPSGEILERQVVSIAADGLLVWEHFVAEGHSMFFFREMLLSYNPTLRRVDDFVVEDEGGERLFLYSVNDAGILSRIF